jgi:hypothetical protein
VVDNCSKALEAWKTRSTVRRGSGGGEVGQRGAAGGKQGLSQRAGGSEAGAPGIRFGSP